MTTRQRTTSGSRSKDTYGLWRPSDGSDSDRPRQTMTSTQRHNVDQIGGADVPRKHHSSRRVDPADLLDPSATHSRHHHKSSTKDRSSIAHQSTYYTVPPSPNPSVQYQTQDAYYDLRAYLKKKTDKRSPRSSKEKVLSGDEVKIARSGHRSRHPYPETATSTQAAAPSQSYANPSTHTTRDPASSSRHHREREKDREKTSSRDPERPRTRDQAVEKNEDRERRRRREKEGEKERSSKDKERRREKDRHQEREARASVEQRPVDAASVYQSYAQGAAVSQRSADKIPVPHPEYTRPPSTQPQVTTQHPTATPSAAPWAGLTSAGRGVAPYAPEPAYPYTSDKDDPPLPIPPPERQRERTSSKPHRSHHHQASSQQAGQDSGISSSEQEHDKPRKTDRNHVSREWASILQRGYSSGPSGSENEKAPTNQKERRKHRTPGESSRRRSASVDQQGAPGPTSSQEIASAWYQRHQREPSGSRATAPVVDPVSQKSLSGVSTLVVPAHSSVPPSGKPTSSVGLTASKRYTPHIVSIRAGQGPADPQTLPKIIHSGTTPMRQPEPLPPQQYQELSIRQPDTPLQTALSQGHTTTYAEAPMGYHHSSVNPSAATPYQQPAQSHLHTSSHTRYPEPNGVTSAVMHGSHQSIPDVVIRPPSTAPAPSDQYHSRPVVLAQPAPTSTGRLQVPSGESRSRSTSAAVTQPVTYTQSIVQPQSSSSAHYGETVQYRSGVGTHTKAPSQDLPNRFPVYEDPQTARVPASSAPHPPPVSPKRGLTYPGASAPAPTTSVHLNPSNYSGGASNDMRSPKPPSVATLAHDAATSRLQPYISGLSAVVPRALSAGSSSNTPKQSPSAHLHSHRNGSNDTITHVAPTKPSPNGSSQQQLPHNTSAVNLQPNVQSRPDNATASRQTDALPAYPEQIRYRSPAPQAQQGYPNAYFSSSAPNVAAATHSQAYSTQTPITSNDYQYGRSAMTPTQGTFAAQQAQASTAQARSRSGQLADYGFRSPESAQSTIPLSGAAPTSGQRVPPRTAPSPVPTVRPPRLTAVSSPSAKVPAPLHSAPLQSTRQQTYPAPGSNYSTTTPGTHSHSRTVSDPQYVGRAGASGYASASLPTRGHQSSRSAPSTAPAPAPQPDILHTPSSLAPSTLPPAPTVPLNRTTSKNSTKEKEKEGKKKGLFGISFFRSRSSPPKQREEPPPPSSQQVREKRERNVSQPSQPAVYLQANGVARPSTAAPSAPPTASTGPQVALAAAAAVSVPAAPQRQRGVVPIAAPAPVSAAGHRSANGKMFTPFRLLSKRHHTVSTASVEAVDGTVINAMLTGGDSTRSSTAGRPSPPLRDPMMAAHEWRVKEYEQQVRGTLRMRRPGVVFDIDEDVPEDGRPSIQKSMRANMQSLQSAAAQAQAQGQGQAPTQPQPQPQPQPYGQAHPQSQSQSYSEAHAQTYAQQHSQHPHYAAHPHAIPARQATA